MEEGPAQEIWSSAHFQYTLAYVEQFYDRVLVMSYKYGLIKPTDIIQSYDIDMRTAKPREHIRWWYKLREQIINLCQDDPPAFLSLFTGNFDRERIIRLFVQNNVEQVTVPWQGRGIGQRMQAVFDAIPPFDVEKVKRGEYKVDLTAPVDRQSKYLPQPTSLTDEIVWE